MFELRRYTLVLLLCTLGINLQAQDCYLYIGTYTSNKDGSRTGSEGIYVYGFDSKTGKLDSIGSTASTVESPSYLCLSPDGKYLYAGTDTRTAGQWSVSSFAIDPSTGLLKFMDKEPSGGDNPLFVDVSADGKSLACANYSGSSFAVFPLDGKGGIEKRSMYSFFEGKGTHPTRQEKPHPHAAAFVPNTNSVLVVDFGLDEMHLIRLQPQPAYWTQKLDTNNGMVAGNGPRHVAFHPNGKFVFVVEELSGTVATFYFNGENLGNIARTAAHAPDSSGPFESADIHLSPDGKFLYVSNRGLENNIAIFSVDPENGSLQPLGYQSTLGVTPRNFTIDPSGNFLLVTNQSTGNVIVFKRDHKTGMLTATGESINLPQPSCLKILKK